jgi:hypothetical protein
VLKFDREVSFVDFVRHAASAELPITSLAPRLAESSQSVSAPCHGRRDIPPPPAPHPHPPASSATTATTGASADPRMGEYTTLTTPAPPPARQTRRLRPRARRRRRQHRRRLQRSKHLELMDIVISMFRYTFNATYSPPHKLRSSCYTFAACVSVAV